MQIDIEQALGINGNDPCFCASGNVFRFCCYRIADKIIKALTLADDGRYLAALRTLDNLEPAPGSAEVHGIRAQVYSMMDDLDSMHAELDKAEKINPDYPRAAFIRANTLFEDEQFAPAIEMYERALKNYPPGCKMFISEVLASKGFCHFCMGDPAAAYADWKRGLEIFPDDVVIPSLLDENIYENPAAPPELARKDEFYYRFVEPALREEFDDLDSDEELDEGAIEAFEEGELDEDTIDIINSLTKKAVRAIEKGNHLAAIKHLEKALDTHPFIPNALVTLYYLYGEAGRIEDAVDCLYELADIPEEPSHVVLALGGITSFHFIAAANLIFPMLYRRGKNGARAVFRTAKIPLTNGDAALERLASSRIATDSSERPGGGIEFFCIGDPKKKRANPGEFFFIRVYPEKNIACFDTVFHNKYDEFLERTLQALGPVAAGAPSEQFDTTLFSPGQLADFQLVYDEYDDEFEEDDAENHHEGYSPFSGEYADDDILDFEVVPLAECEQSAADFARMFFEDLWLNTPAPGLGGLTPLEAAADDELAPVIPAAIDHIEGFIAAACEAADLKYDFSRLRAAAGLQPEKQE